jgi:hypothetical protein
MLERIDDYNWREAFGFAGDPGRTDASGYYDGACTIEQVERVPGQQKTVSNAPCLREDVETIIAIDDGENDEANWLGLFKMKDGRYLALSAGCDYTGWD